MKKISFLLLCVVLFASCDKYKIVKGNGDVVTQTVAVRDFNKIFTDIPAEVKYTQGENYECSVTLDSNLFKYLKFRVVDGKLKLCFDEKYRIDMKYTKFEVEITAPELTDVELAGSGNVNFINDFKGNNLRLNISGSGNIDTKKLVLKSLSGELTGSGDLDMENVSADNAEVNKSGSGACAVKNLVTPQMNIVSSGSGSIDVQAGEITDLQVKNSGSGVLYVYENITTADATVTGSGTVTLGQISERLTYYLTGSGNLIYSGNCETSGSCTGSGQLMKK